MCIKSVNIHWCISELPIGYCNRCQAQKKHGKIPMIDYRYMRVVHRIHRLIKDVYQIATIFLVGLETFDVMSKGTHHRATI